MNVGKDGLTLILDYNTERRRENGMKAVVVILIKVRFVNTF